MSRIAHFTINNHADQCQLKKQYVNEVVLKTDPWLPSTREELDTLLAKLLFLYRRVVVGGDEDAAKEQLRSQLREKVVVDRETVWSQMVSGHRGQGIFRSVEQEEQGVFEAGQGSFKTPLGRLQIPAWWSTKGVIFALAVGVLVVITQLPLFDRQEETNCLALLIFCTILWATEVSRAAEGVEVQGRWEYTDGIGYPTVCDISLGAFPSGHPPGPAINRRQRLPLDSIGRYKVSFSYHLYFVLVFGKLTAVRTGAKS